MYVLDKASKMEFLFEKSVRGGLYFRFARSNKHADAQTNFLFNYFG